MPRNEASQHPRRFRRKLVAALTTVTLIGGVEAIPQVQHYESIKIHALQGTQKPSVALPSTSPICTGAKMFEQIPSLASTTPESRSYTDSSVQPEREKIQPPKSDNPFFTLKNRRIYLANGKEFNAYGISVVTDIGQPNWSQYERATDAQIIAAVLYWHANTVRIQASEQDVLNYPTKGLGYNDKVMQRMCQEVAEIIQLGAVPIINDNTLNTDKKDKNPTPETLRFWDVVTSYFAKRNINGVLDPVILDVFNEPRDFRDKNAWEIWRNGNGSNYVGEQDIVTRIRKEKNNFSNHLLIVEGPFYASTLARLDQYQVDDPHKDTAYGFHHVNTDNQSTWNRDTGVGLKDGETVIEGEYSQFASQTRSECHPNAPRMIPIFLSYLKAHDISVIDWTLESEVMVEGIGENKKHVSVSDTLNSSFSTNPRDYAAPTKFGIIYSCSNRASGQGDGQDMQRFFAQNSRPLQKV